MAETGLGASETDTIAAVATPPGRGGVAIVRLSGPQALNIAQRLLGRRLPPRRAVHCRFLDTAGEVLDDGIALAFQRPRSFTGEDVVELQGHGGPVVVQQVLEACLQAGARPARPGEFSERAFLNDRLDLVQAEAVADLIDAASGAAARAAMQSLQGAFSERIHALMDATTELRVYVEAAIDFPDEDVDFLAEGDVGQRLQGLCARISEVETAAGQGRLLTDGITLVLAGAPNAGKSSLMNALAQRDTAIVTDIAGTTRDLLRERISLDGLPVQVVDTAGLRDSDDPIEQEGVRRARDAISEADGLLYLVDVASVETVPETLAAVRQRVGADLPDRVLLVLTKTDLLPSDPVLAGCELPWVGISALTGAGLAELVGQLKSAVGFSEQQTVFTARARHLDALRRARVRLQDADETLAATGAGDLLAEDLRWAHDALGEIVGAVTPDALLGEIFSSFCIGK